MKVLLLACLLAVASAASNELLGSIKCTWGPAYWCKNYNQALECNAIEHCKIHAWKSNDMCGDCKKVVGEVNSFVKNHSAEIVNMMNELCDTLGQLSEECKMMVSLYGQTIIEYIENTTADSEKLCEELSMCTKTREEVQHVLRKMFIKKFRSSAPLMKLKSLKADDYCEDCKLVFGEIKDVLENKDLQKDVIELLEKICMELGTYKTECKNLVDQYGPFVIQELDSLINGSAICTDLGLCNSANEVVAAKLLKPAQSLAGKLFFPMAPGPVIINPLENVKKPELPKAGLECILCEYIMSELAGILKDNATKAEIEEALEKVCSLLPSTITTECDAFVEKYTAMIIALLEADLTPQELCTALGLCTPGKKSVQVSLKNDLNDIGATTCEVCQLMAQYLESVLTTHATEEEIKKALEELCSYLPGAVQTECTALVDEYSDEIIKLLLEGLTPAELCKELGLCPAGMNNYVKNKCYLGESYWCANIHNALKCKCWKETQESSRVNEVNTEAFWCTLKRFYELYEIKGSLGNNTKYCQECKNDLKYIDDLFPKNMTKDQLLAAMKLYCTRFTPVMETYCEDLLKKYGDFIADILLGKIDPEKFCEKLGFCKPDKNPWLKMKCYLGKSYWCANHQNAVDCQTVERC